MKLKECLKANTLSVGSWVTIGHHSIVEIMASAGFDWLVIDMEHSAISLSKAQELIMVIQSKNMAALVRVGANDELIIKQIMDAGADGVVVPMINTKEDAEKAVKSVKYPPEGNRGVGLARAQEYGFGFDEYKEWLKNNSIIIAQIEHKDAVKNIDEIISVEGIDGTIIGPYDMSASFDIPGELDSPILLNAIKKVEKACHGSNFPLGYHVIKPNQLEVQVKADSGYSFIAFSLDFFFLGEKVREEMDALNNE